MGKNLKRGRFQIWGTFVLFFVMSYLPHSKADTLNIMPFGDSLTAGAYIINGVYHTDSGYRETLWNLLEDAQQEVHFVGSYHDGLPGFSESHHEGHSGWRIDQISAGAKEWVKAANPDVVLLLIGTNDCIQNYDLTHAMERMDQLVSNIKASAPSATLYISTTIPHSNPDVQARVLTFNQNLTDWVAARQKTDSTLRFVDMYHESKLQISDLIDGVHPTPEGYARMGQVWFQHLSTNHVVF